MFQPLPIENKKIQIIRRDPDGRSKGDKLENIFAKEQSRWQGTVVKHYPFIVSVRLDNGRIESFSKSDFQKGILRYSYIDNEGDI